MKKIGLCYREFLVGILEYDGENFIYNSNNNLINILQIILFQIIAGQLYPF